MNSAPDERGIDRAVTLNIERAMLSLLSELPLVCLASQMLSLNN